MDNELSCKLMETKVLPPELLDIVSDYSGTDSVEKILSIVDLFEFDKVYEIMFYSNNAYKILSYLNSINNPPTYTSIVQKYKNIKMSTFAFSVQYKQNTLHVNGYENRHTNKTDCIIYISIKRYFPTLNITL
jgi:uncharacterized protein YbgA (DUF1722 family)